MGSMNGENRLELVTYGARVWEGPEPRRSGENFVGEHISVNNFLDCAAEEKCNSR